MSSIDPAAPRGVETTSIDDETDRYLPDKLDIIYIHGSFHAWSDGGDDQEATSIKGGYCSFNIKLC